MWEVVNEAGQETTKDGTLLTGPLSLPTLFQDPNAFTDPRCLFDPGYRPPRQHLPVKDQQRNLRTDWILLRVATVVIVPVVIALVVIIALMVAAHS
ncbi:hypothetical protein EAS64_00265 [Trebonia kvetii]|uniref:Uncharacterized protein n=1 Tax=Trebonia kvetii TaxID=2480626 RepID=A0A6P2C4P6_9ACTN|nr:hypothetical protein [Trebonia kvetii]TVZ05947.1 hypothetical protein EAS64_00265 [Trebonia kvetii]